MAAAHYRHTATALANGKVLVTSGYDATSLGATAELYDPAANAWRSAGALQTARYVHGAVALDDGRVLVAGGIGADSKALASAEVWTPTTSLVDDAALAFPDTAIAGSGTAVVQVTNTGDSPLLTGDLTIGGASPADFAVSGDRCRGPIAPAATCLLNVAFSPTAPGARSATLTLSANTESGTHAVTLSGRGVAPSPPPAAVLRRISVLVSYSYKAFTRTTRFTRLQIRNVPAGSTVKVTCRKGCARKTYTKRNARGTVSLKPVVAKPVKVKSAITVVVSRPGEIAAVKTITIRARKEPKVVTRCLPPGASRPQSCG
jgi:hypothetical protein